MNFETNPFVNTDKPNQSFTYERTRKHGKHQIINDKGQRLGNVTMWRMEMSDRESFIKIYKSGIDNLFPLSSSSQVLFKYICRVLKPNKDIVFLDGKEFIREYGIKSVNTFYKCLAELIDNQIIANTNEKGFYFININFFFNGDRIKFIQNKIRYDDKN